MIRIAFVTSGLGTGGAEMMLLKLLTNLDRAQFETAVFSLTGEGTLGARFQTLGIPVFCANMRSVSNVPNDLLKLRRAVGAFKPNLLQGWMYHGNLFASLVALTSSRSIPVLWSIRQSLYELAREKWVTRQVIRLGKRLSRHPRAIIYNARKSAEQHEALGFAAERRHIVPNGFDCDLFLPDLSARKALRSELGLPEQVHMIGLIARYHPMKDHTNFLEAAALLSQSRRDVAFVLVGKGTEVENDELTQRIERLALTQSVHRLGERADIPRITAALDIASCTSSWGDAFPNAIGEAMASGVPCVVTDVGDCAWIVGDTGKVVNRQDAAALALAWSELLNLGPEARYLLGSRARARVLEHLALPAVVSRFAALFECVQGGR